MKKTKWFGFALAASTLAVLLSACAPTGSGNTGGTGGKPSGGSGKGDSYEDYQPDKQPGGDQFDFDGNYESPELVIDGKGDDEQWQSAPVLTTFGKKINGQDAVTVKAYRGNSALFFLFDVVDPVLLTYGNTNDDAVTHSDSIEFYIDTLANGGSRPQSDDYQINLGIHGKTRIMQGAGGQWGNWNGLIDYDVDLKGGTLNNGTNPDDTGYSIEVMVPYAQVMIEKDDTIAVSFGQVDKTGEGNASGTDWDWYGWTWGGFLREPQTINNYVLLDKDNNLIDREDQARPAADMAAYVTNAAGEAIVGATAKTTVGGEEVTVTTGEDGYFVFENVDSEGTYNVLISAEGYLDGQLTYTRAELRAVNGGRVLKNIELTATAGLETTTLTGTVKNIIEGAVAGATVTVKGTTLTATAGADGTFSLDSVPANTGSVTLVVTKSGYGDSVTVIPEELLTAGGTTALGDVNLNLPYANGGEFATGAGKTGANIQLFANIHVEISRALTGVEFHFDSERFLHGKIELYLDTKECASNRDNDATAWRFDLYEDRIEGSHFAGGAFTAAGLVYNVAGNTSEEGFHATLLIPYGYLDITPFEVFGISLGQWSTAANGGNGDWDGWAPNPFGFIAPETPATYLRVGARNNFYQANNNETTATFSGNVGVAGITVAANGKTTVSDGSGNWRMTVPVTGAEIEVTYSGQGYVTKTTVIPANYFGGAVSTWSENVTLDVQYVTVSGTVTDENGKPIENVDVQITGAHGLNIAVKTNSEGKYVLKNVTVFGDATIVFSLENYASGTETLTAAVLAGGAEHTVDKQLTSVSSVKYITLTSKVNGIAGALGGVTVTAGELTATTAADGSFTLANFPLVDGELTLTAEGYTSATVAFRASSVEEGAAEYALADIFLAREFTKLGTAFGTKSDAFAGFVPSVTRGESAFEFRFEGTRAFTGTIEFFVDTKLSSGDGGRNSTDYRFDLRADGSIGVDNFGGSNTGISTLTLKVTGADTESPVVNFSLPYAFLGVERAEIIGVTFGQVAGGDWDGWTSKELGVNGIEFVQPERTWDYIRIGVDNAPFWNAENKTLEELDLTAYNLHFGKGAADDSFHARVVSRDAEGITFEFVTLGDFASRDGNLEAVLLYFDTGAPAGGWGVDYQFKLVSDGNVYGGAQAWYKADDAHKLGTFAITRENGVTRFTYKVLYSTINATANEVVGFTVIEGWLTGDNGSNEYGNGLTYSYAGGCHVVADAADTAGYVRIKADGTLVVASSNGAVS